MTEHLTDCHVTNIQYILIGLAYVLFWDVTGIPTSTKE